MVTLYPIRIDLSTSSGGQRVVGEVDNKENEFLDKKQVSMDVPPSTMVSFNIQSPLEYLARN
jgi:hypothetical protein